MSKQTKIIIGVAVGLAGLCLIACVVAVFAFNFLGGQVTRTLSESVESDPTKIDAIAAEVADINLPPGFSSESSIDLAGIKMAMYTNNGNDNFLMLFQIPSKDEITQESIDNMRSYVDRSSGRRFSNMHTIEERDLTIRGKPAKMVLMEGQDDEGNSIRQMLVAFQGKSGIAMLAAFGPTSSWDQAAYDQLINSIR